MFGLSYRGRAHVCYRSRATDPTTAVPAAADPSPSPRANHRRRSSSCSAATEQRVFVRTPSRASGSRAHFTAGLKAFAPWSGFEWLRHPPGRETIGDDLS